MTISPAALTAATSGDVDNLFIALTPGGIEAQEAAGQIALVKASDRLPRVIRPHSVDLARVAQAWGMKLGDVVDDLFISVVLPEGWRIEATDHSMHSALIDASGAERAGIFYKAAFYDRRASLTVNRRYVVHVEYGEETNVVSVKDMKSQTTIHDAGTYGRKNHSVGDSMSDAAKVWLDREFPQHDDPLAYWD